MNALVTGGAGFIGSHLAEELCRRGSRVTVLDNLSYGTLDNLSWRKPGDHLEFVQGDVNDSSLLRKILPGCEIVFHQAAIASVPYSVAEPVVSNIHNLDASLTLLAECCRSGVRRVVFASSCSIYGDLPGAAVEDTPVDPLSPYALQKFAAERYTQLFCRFQGLETVALRYFNVFGPRQPASSPYSAVIPLFCRRFLAGEQPVVLGDGLQTRDFVYVENVVRANLLAAEKPGVAGKVFNIGTGASATLLDLIAELNRLTGLSLEPIFKAPRPGDVRYSSGRIDRARSSLHFEPSVSWQEGLRRTLEFYRNASRTMSS